MSEREMTLQEWNAPPTRFEVTGTKGCACAAAGARLCYLIRYNVDPADDEMDDGTCECLCHHWSECDE